METSGGDRAKRLMSLFPVFLSLSLLLYLALNLSAHLSLSTSTKRLHFSSRCFFPPPHPIKQRVLGYNDFLIISNSFCTAPSSPLLSPTTFLCRLPLPPRKRQKQCNILMQHRAKLCQSLRRNSAAECNQAGVTRGTRNGPIFVSWRCQTGKRQQRLFSGLCDWKWSMTFCDKLQLFVPCFFCFFFLNSPLSQNAQLSCSLFLVKSSVLFKSGKQVSRRVHALRCRVSL